MNKFLLILGYFIFQLNFLSAQEPFRYICKRYFETDDCLISFLEYSESKFVVKQIKNPSPDEQFLLVLDATGCHIAEASSIPMNKLTIISPHIDFSGKNNGKFPATLHTMAKGVSTDQECRYPHIDLHQKRYRKENSPMWHRWGSIAPENTGLTFTIIQSMAQHPDLPGLVALDTFVGNADRSSPNLFYDAVTDRFCGIDMGAAFCSTLPFEACRQLRTLEKTAFTLKEKSALESYAHTLQDLIENWPPEKQESLLLENSKTAGMSEGEPLFDQNVAERIEFHKKCMIQNYQDCVELVKIIKQIFA